MAIEGVEEASWAHQKGKLGTNPDFHMEEKKDDVEILIDQKGWDRAFQEVEEKFDTNPGDQESRRQLELIVRLDDERKAKIRTKLNH